MVKTKRALSQQQQEEQHHHVLVVSNILQVTKELWNVSKQPKQQQPDQDRKQIRSRRSSWKVDDNYCEKEKEDDEKKSNRKKRGDSTRLDLDHCIDVVRRLELELSINDNYSDKDSRKNSTNQKTNATKRAATLDKKISKDKVACDTSAKDEEDAEGNEIQHNYYCQTVDSASTNRLARMVPNEKLMTILKTLSLAKRTFGSCMASSGSTDSGWVTLYRRVLHLELHIQAAKRIASSSLIREQRSAPALLSTATRSSRSSTLFSTHSETSQKQHHPTSIKEYQGRLERYNKELHKNPPAMPPPEIQYDDVEWLSNKEPKRNSKTGHLTFEPGPRRTERHKQDGEDGDAQSSDDDDDDESKYLLLCKLLKDDFHPNVTPEEILRGGAFGGTYFRPIHSAVTNRYYDNPFETVLPHTIDMNWIKGLDVKTMIISSTYRPSINKYGVKCGGSLGMWESSGWISNIDPYGWFQWYCNFYRGRRCISLDEDIRQIQRYCGIASIKGRFRSQICNRIIKANTTANDVSISPVIRQTLFHWGLTITNDIVQQHRERQEKKK